MQLGQIFFVSMDSLKTNKLRTMLTILGVVVGIFSVIVIVTIITMLQSSIESGLSRLSENTFQIQKWPAIRTGGHNWWIKYHNRKNIRLEDYYRLKEKLVMAKYIGAEQWRGGIVVRYGNIESNPNISLAGITPEAMKTNNWIVDYGRDIRELDVLYSNNVCLIGQDIADLLFPNIYPLGQVIKIDKKLFKVIGVLEKQPQLFGQSRDNYAVIPISVFQSMYGKYSRSINITVMSNSQNDYNTTIEAAIGYFRTIRKVPPGEENDFEIYSNESLLGQINDITGGVKIGAMIVSIIALLAAGVGIMNIMLVSVTERTREIGIRKAVGARKSNILVQFLAEAITLCCIGGVIGIILGIGIGNLAGGFLNATTAIPYDWVILGLSICVLVGIIFGTYPAYKAANLDPIEALRYE